MMRSRAPAWMSPLRDLNANPPIEPKLDRELPAGGRARIDCEIGSHFKPRVPLNLLLFPVLQNAWKIMDKYGCFF